MYNKPDRFPVRQQKGSTVDILTQILKRYQHIFECKLTGEGNHTAILKTQVKLSTGNAFGIKKHCSTSENFVETASEMLNYYPLHNQGLKALPERKSNPKETG